MDPALSIVMPVYNEGPAIAGVLRRIEESVRTPHETLVVYDFDEDTTVGPTLALAEEIPSVRAHKNDFGRGALNAMRSGLAAAKGDYVLVTMADGCDEVHLVDDMVRRAQGGAAVVAASRYMKGGRQVGGPPLKSFLSRTAGLTLHYVGRLPTHDATNSFKLYDRSFLNDVTIESQGGFELALELTVKAHLAGRRIDEIPTTWQERVEGESRFRLRQWLPHYIRWYIRGLTAPVYRRANRRQTAGAGRTAG